MGAKTSKRYSSLKSLESFQTFSEFSSQRSSQKYCFRFLRNFKLPIFNDFFNFTIVLYEGTKDRNYLENERA